MTGWRVGYAACPRPLARAARHAPGTDGVVHLRGQPARRPGRLAGPSGRRRPTSARSTVAAARPRRRPARRRRVRRGAARRRLLPDGPPGAGHRQPAGRPRPRRARRGDRAGNGLRRRRRPTSCACRSPPRRAALRGGIERLVAWTQLDRGRGVAQYVGDVSVPAVPADVDPQELRAARGAQGRRPRRLSGEHVVVFGPSGSGKSTLLRTINLLERPTSGSVCVYGTEYGPGLPGERPARGPADRAAPPGRHGLPAVQPVPPPQRPRQRRHRTAPGEAMSKRDARQRAAVELRRVGLLVPRGQVPQRAVRRPAAARRDRPGVGDGPQGDAVRRADVGARPRARRRGAGDDAPGRHAGHDDGGRHPRDGLRQARSATSTCSWRTGASSNRAAARSSAKPSTSAPASSSRPCCDWSCE